MLRELPRCWNWETAVLHAFSSTFHSMLDLEKMWSVNILALTARDPSQVWSKVACLDKLSDILAIPTQLRVATNALPEREVMSWQQAISSRDFPFQTGVFQQKLSQLTALRLNARPRLCR